MIQYENSMMNFWFLLIELKIHVVDRGKNRNKSNATLFFKYSLKYSELDTYVESDQICKCI